MHITCVTSCIRHQGERPGDFPSPVSPCMVFEKGQTYLEFYSLQKMPSHLGRLSISSPVASAGGRSSGRGSATFFLLPDGVRDLLAEDLTSSAGVVGLVALSAVPSPLAILWAVDSGRPSIGSYQLWGSQCQAHTNSKRVLGSSVPKVIYGHR